MLHAQKPPPAKTYKEPPAFQIMLLGSSGGPREDNVTGLLVRSLSTNWQNNSLVAVDAGTMLGGIIRCLELSDTKPVDYKGENDGVQMLNGAFEGLKLPHKAAESNGAFIFRHLIQSVLVTHAHLDHCSALALNSPLIETETAPKTISALPSVIAALKSYIFNGIIWPNLSDEDEGAGLLTYQRLSDGGNPMLGRGIGRGYVESCKGIMTKAMSISHGKSKQKYNPDTDKFERLAQHPPSDRPKSADSARAEGRDASKTDTDTPIEKAYDQTWAAVDSTAFFLLDIHSGSELLFFGDLEPDSISIRPRNARVWREAARKMATNSLKGIFVECSYPDAVDDQTLFGHMCPRHLVAELSRFAKYVKRERKIQAEKKKGDDEYGSSSPEQQNGDEEKGSEQDNDHKTENDPRHEDDASNDSSGSKHSSNGNENSGNNDDSGDTVPVEESQKTGKSDFSPPRSEGEDEDIDVSDKPLEGLKVFIAHIKEELSLPKSARKKIMEQLHQRIEETGLGCDVISLLAGEVAYL